MALKCCCATIDLCCCGPCWDTCSAPRDGATADEWWPRVAKPEVPEPFRGVACRAELRLPRRASRKAQVMWLPGNIDPGLLSFDASAFRNNVIRFRIFAPDNWASSTTKLSQSACLLAQYNVYVAKDEKSATIRPTWLLPCCGCGRLEVCTCCAHFTMKQHADDPHLWARDSVVCRSCCGDYLTKQYTLTRVIDAAGARTPHYEAFAAAKKSAALTVRTPNPCLCGLDTAPRAGSSRVEPCPPAGQEIER